MNRTALIVGATGLVGRSCLATLLRSQTYDRVVAVTRRPLVTHHEGLVNLVCDFDLLEQHKQAFAVQDVFCCLGTTLKQAGSREAFRKVDYDYCLKVAQLAREKQVQHFLIVSAINANRYSPVYYSQIKGDLEKRISTLQFPLLSIFQPSLLLGQRQEFRLAEEVGGAVMRLVAPLMQGALKNYRPIPAAMVGAAMVAQALQAEPGGEPHIERLRYEEMERLVGLLDLPEEE